MARADRAAAEALRAAGWPRDRVQSLEFGPATGSEQPALAAELLAQGQRVELVAQLRAQADQLVAMPEQLARGRVRPVREPRSSESSLQEQIEDQPGVALIGLLLAHLTGANLGGITDQQFVAEFREQTLEPVSGPVASMPTRTGA